MDPLEFLDETLRVLYPFSGPFRERQSSLFAKPAPPDVGTPEPGPMHSSSRYYAGDKYGYQSPESYKEIYKGFPKAYIDTINKTPKDKPPNTGDFRSADNKYYTDEKYGYQSPDSYNKVIGSYPAGYVKPRTGTGTGTGTAIPGNVKAAVSNTVSETKTPTSLDGFTEFAKEIIAGAEKQAEASFYRTQQQTDKYAQYSMEKSRENTARQIELENIKRWREIEVARIEAGTRSAALTTGLLTMLQQPNANFIDALSAASQSAASAFSAGRGRVG